MRKFPLSEFLSVIKIPILFLIICWVIFLSDYFFNLNLYQFGISPRKSLGLLGILFSPFIHGDFGHILNNSLPILVLGSTLFYFYKPIAWSSIIWIWFISGIWLWIGGRNNDVILNYHFGASTLIYGFSTFLFFSGVFRKHKQLMMVSAFVVFMYGSITYGMFPFDVKVSWEGHLFGALSGALVAFSYRKEGPQAIEHVWPEEERDLEAEYNKQVEEERNQINLDNQNQSVNIVYHYKPENSNKSETNK